MNENINLVEILKDCPKGTILYSPLAGEVEFYDIEVNGNLPIRVMLKGDLNTTFWFTKDGRHYDYPDGECTLFPSKEQRDWSKFTAPWLEKQGEPNPYIGVSFKYNGRTWVMCARDGGVAILVDGEIKERIFLNNKPRGKSSLEALKEEKVDNANKVEPKFMVGDWVVNKFGDPWHIDSFDKKNYQVSDGKGNYNYFPISDQDEMLVSKKFDPKTLKPFDKVLVRDTYKKEWSCNFFSHISNDGVYYPYITLNIGYVFCIPYNEDTKHLVGTTDEAPEYYRYWED